MYSVQDLDKGIIPVFSRVEEEQKRKEKEQKTHLHLPEISLQGQQIISSSIYLFTHRQQTVRMVC